jgi:hypothetical protein
MQRRGRGGVAPGCLRAAFGPRRPNRLRKPRGWRGLAFTHRQGSGRRGCRWARPVGPSDWPTPGGRLQPPTSPRSASTRSLPGWICRPTLGRTGGGSLTRERRGTGAGRCLSASGGSTGLLHLFGGWRGGEPLHEAPLADWDLLHDLLIRTVQHTTPRLSRRADWRRHGRFVLVSSKQAQATQRRARRADLPHARDAGGRPQPRGDPARARRR